MKQFVWLWGHDKLSDVRLRVLPSGCGDDNSHAVAARRPEHSEAESSELALHSVVLASASPGYFRTHLLRLHDNASHTACREGFTASTQSHTAKPTGQEGTSKNLGPCTAAVNNTYSSVLGPDSTQTASSQPPSGTPGDPPATFGAGSTAPASDSKNLGPRTAPCHTIPPSSSSVPDPLQTASATLHQPSAATKPLFTFGADHTAPKTFLPVLPAETSVPSVVFTVTPARPRRRVHRPQSTTGTTTAGGGTVAGAQRKPTIIGPTAQFSAVRGASTPPLACARPGAANDDAEGARGSIHGSGDAASALISLDNNTGAAGTENTAAAPVSHPVDSTSSAASPAQPPPAAECTAKTSNIDKHPAAPSPVQSASTTDTADTADTTSTKDQGSMGASAAAQATPAKGTAPANTPAAADTDAAGPADSVPPCVHQVVPVLRLQLTLHPGEPASVPKAVLRHVYTGELPEDPELLIWMTWRADYLDLAATVRACLAKLRCLVNRGRLTLRHATLLHSLPPLQTAEHLANKQASAQLTDRILSGKLPVATDILNDNQLLFEFTQLPLALVKQWVGLDKIVIDSGNTLAVLLTAYYLAQPASDRQALQQPLSALLPLSSLSVCFHLQAMSRLFWFKPAKELHRDTGLQHVLARICPSSTQLQEAWSQHAGTGRLKTSGAASFTWQVDSSGLQQLWSKTALTHPTGAHALGYCWLLTLQLAPKDTAKPAGDYTLELIATPQWPVPFIRTVPILPRPLTAQSAALEGIMQSGVSAVHCDIAIKATLSPVPPATLPRTTTRTSWKGGYFPGTGLRWMNLFGATFGTLKQLAPTKAATLEVECTFQAVASPAAPLTPAPG